ncbi:MAG: sulfide/dihydroorotate dehydrogenase-like FAD/NAD-binding protein [Candidatus Firestonebacteria bacterium]|nr:sulfide/dihydroorotate dehydrogenase-like FAD/NAD-binding protein [Candidatus Firestonebacteria bacterium]
MFELLAKRLIAPQVWRFTLRAPGLAAKRQAGHFLILRPTADSERIPLTIVSSDPVAGSVDIIFQVVGATTRALAAIPEGGTIHDVAGPLGHPTHIENYGTAVMIGGGVGIAPLLPIAQAFHAQGNRLLTILGGRSQEFLILEDDLKPVSDSLLIATDDGSRGQKGLVTDVLRTLLEKEKINLVMAIGPVVMMKAVAEMTRPLKIKTMVSLNPLMIDGTGMCGVCRCKVAGKTRFACVEGPEFDAHEVDFDSIRRRLGMFKAEERKRMDAGKVA